jgi:hypothetical protein
VEGWPQTFKAGAAAQLRFIFSEELGTVLQWDSLTQKGDLKVSGGSLGSLGGRQVLSDGRVQYSAVFTPDQGATGSASITLEDKLFTDRAGNPGLGFSKTASFNTVRPVVEQVLIEGLDANGNPKASTLTPGDIIRISVTFNDEVQHVVSSGAGRASYAFVLDGNALRQADYRGGSGSKTLSFEYTVGLADLDRFGGVTAPANALVLPPGVSLENAFGNTADLRVPASPANTSP